MKKLSTLMLISLLISTCFGLVTFSSAMQNTNLHESAAALPPWPMYRHDPQRTGYSTSAAPSTLRSLWNFTTYGSGWVTSSPSIADGKVFVGSNDSSLYVLNEGTGSVAWVRSAAKDRKSVV